MVNSTRCPTPRGGQTLAAPPRKRDRSRNDRPIKSIPKVHWTLERTERKQVGQGAGEPDRWAAQR
jgi:hypothetical protein